MIIYGIEVSDLNVELLTLPEFIEVENECIKYNENGWVLLEYTEGRKKTLEFIISILDSKNIQDIPVVDIVKMLKDEMMRYPIILDYSYGDFGYGILSGILEKTPHINYTNRITKLFC